MEQNLVTEIALCIIAAWVVAVVSQAARQPLLLAYLVAGFAIGPNGFKFITQTSDIQTISEIGLSLLLFMIGLEIDLKKMLSAGRVITVTAVAQILGGVLLGWLCFNFLGPAGNRLEALYLAVAVAMSSTIRQSQHTQVERQQYRQPRVPEGKRPFVGLPGSAPPPAEDKGRRQEQPHGAQPAKPQPQGAK